MRARGQERGRSIHGGTGSDYTAPLILEAVSGALQQALDSFRSWIGLHLPRSQYSVLCEDEFRAEAK